MEERMNLEKEFQPNPADVVNLTDKSKMPPARIIVLVFEDSGDFRSTEVVGIETAMQDFSNDSANEHIPFTVSGYVAWRQRYCGNHSSVVAAYVGQIS